MHAPPSGTHGGVEDAGPRGYRAPMPRDIVEDAGPHGYRIDYACAHGVPRDRVALILRPAHSRRTDEPSLESSAPQQASRKQAAV